MSLILRGHEHEPDVDWSMGPQGECVVIPAGAAYEKRNANDARPEIVDKLRQTMQTEREPQVLDGLYNAILSLASAPA